MLVDREARPDPASLRDIADTQSMNNVRLSAAMSRGPRIRMLPERAAFRPAMVLHRVLLPIPLRPTTASTPWSICIDTP